MISNETDQPPVSSLGRRRLLQLIGGAGLLTVVGCASNAAKGVASSSTTAAAIGSTSASTVASTSATTGAAATTAATDVSAIPEETAGPYPGDGSNGVNVLTQDGIVRSDIRSSFGSASGVAKGIPATVKLTLFDTAKSGAPISGAAVYLWHCDRDGNYSLYSRGVTGENYLRGVQATDASGTATFTTIYPACYSGRWPHIHFEVYPDVATATKAGTKLATSQLALPKDISTEVYATDGYSQSVRNLSMVSLSTDNVFSDGAELETPTVTGNVSDGFVIQLNVGV